MTSWPSFTFPSRKIKKVAPMKNHEIRTFSSLGGRGHFQTKRDRPHWRSGILTKPGHLLDITFSPLSLFCHFSFRPHPDGRIGNLGPELRSKGNRRSGYTKKGANVADKNKKEWKQPSTQSSENNPQKISFLRSFTTNPLTIQ